MFLSLHIFHNRLLTSFALLLRLSYLGAMKEIVTSLLSVFDDRVRSIIDFAIWLEISGFTSRSSHRKCSMKKGVHKNFAKFTGKHLCQSLFFKNVAGFRRATLLKKKLWNKCFLVNFAKFSRTPFYRTLPDDCFWK